MKITKITNCSYRIIHNDRKFIIFLLDVVDVSVDVGGGCRVHGCHVIEYTDKRLVRKTTHRTPSALLSDINESYILNCIKQHLIKRL